MNHDIFGRRQSGTPAYLNEAYGYWTTKGKILDVLNVESLQPNERVFYLTNMFEDFYSLRPPMREHSYLKDFEMHCKIKYIIKNNINTVSKKKKLPSIGKKQYELPVNYYSKKLNFLYLDPINSKLNAGSLKRSSVKGLPDIDPKKKIQGQFYMGGSIKTDPDLAEKKSLSPFRNLFKTSVSRNIDDEDVFENGHKPFEGSGKLLTFLKHKIYLNNKTMNKNLEKYSHVELSEVQWKKVFDDFVLKGQSFKEYAKHVKKNQFRTKRNTILLVYFEHESKMIQYYIDKVFRYIQAFFYPFKVEKHIYNSSHLEINEYYDDLEEIYFMNNHILKIISLGLNALQQTNECVERKEKSYITIYSIYNFFKNHEITKIKVKHNIYFANILSRLCAKSIYKCLKINHCTYFDCLLNNYKTLEELAELNDNLCPVCLRKFIHSVGIDLFYYYNRLLVLFTNLNKETIPQYPQIQDYYGEILYFLNKRIFIIKKYREELNINGDTHEIFYTERSQYYQ